MFSPEVPGSNSGNILMSFYPTMTVLLEYLDSAIYSYLVLAL